MNDEFDIIERIIPPPLPYGLDDKIFGNYDDEGNLLGELYSYNDAVKQIKSMSNLNSDFLSDSCLQKQIEEVKKKYERKTLS